MDNNKKAQWVELKKRWDRVVPGLTVEEAEQIMGFRFVLDSRNKAGRMVYSHHTHDYLPFYLVVNELSGLIIRRHDIRALNEVAAGT